MKYKCPKCSTSTECNYSRYYVWQCDSCLHKARGIHWDADMVDYYLKSIPFSPLFWKRAIFNPSDRTYDFKFEGGGPDVTACPHCGNDVYGNYGKTANGSWPSVCGSCMNRLPTHHFVEKTQQQVLQEMTVVEKEKPFMEKYEIKAASEEKSDCEKLRELINRL